MPSFSWLQRPSPIAGLVWVPILRFHMRDRAGTFRQVEARYDTGAVVSLLRRSVGDMLGLDVPSGRRVEFGRFQGGELPAYLHDVEFRFALGGVVIAPFAIAERDDVPNLLGRAGIFERFEVVLDPIRRVTIVNGPVV